ncbi:MAG: hypothetical protein GF350_01845 [Chitinivibrionales bacterium]|nr:hypothetical protein [Chitinivibrionales bacterium]
MMGLQYSNTPIPQFLKGLSMSLPPDYPERVYAGVLGKIIGVYFGMPVENKQYDWIMNKYGEIDYYIRNDPTNSRSQVLVNTSDDITGMFMSVRSMPDNGNPPDITAEQIGNTWRNYSLLYRSASWWGGMGSSSEHTALVRLLSGIKAPDSGSIRLNGPVVAQQIGARIFIDSWPMIVPGDPERAADFARHAASVTHDGEAIYGAQQIAAMESLAFVEPDLE